MSEREEGCGREERIVIFFFLFFSVWIRAKKGRRATDKVCEGGGKARL